MEWETVERLLERLRTLRTARGLTQEQFAEQSGISYKYYQSVEAGRKKDLRLSTLDRLAKAHGMETWQLLLPNDGRDVHPSSTDHPSKPAKKQSKRKK